MRVLTTLALATSAVVAFQQPEQDSPVMLMQGQVHPVNNLRALKGQLEETNQVKDGKVRRRLNFWTGAAGGGLGGQLLGLLAGGVGGAVLGSKLNFRRNKSKRAKNPEESSGYYGEESAGHYGEENAGHYGEESAGRYGKQSAGRYGKQSAGHYGEEYGY
ncbi:unnamed protein product [Aphanomyces euteiches]|nr:hypothetical protein AeRB84_004882 [Aphanomyces euteiches]